MTTNRLELRVSDEWLAALDTWRRGQSDLPSRSEAVRNLVSGRIMDVELIHRYPQAAAAIAYLAKARAEYDKHDAIKTKKDKTP